jgi:PAS domain S-box-containing protein
MKSRPRNRPPASPRAAAASRRIAALERLVAVQRAEAREQLERWLDVHRRLEDSISSYQTLYQDAPFGYATLDPSGLILDINVAGAELLGGQAESVEGKPLLAFVGRTEVDRVLRHLIRCRAGTSTVTSDIILRGPHGTTKTIQLMSRRNWIPGGRVAYHTVLTDISDQRRSEQALRESENRYREIVETAIEGICIVDAENCVVFANPQFARLLGLPPADVIGRSAFEFLLPEDAAHARAQFDRHQTGSGGRSEARLRHNDGTVLWTSVSTSLLLDDAGNFTGMLRMYTDVTDRKELEATRDGVVRRLVAAQEAERTRVAREMHDQLGQHLVGLSLGLNHLAQMTAQAPELHELICKLQVLSDVMSRDAHHLALELRPTALDDLGLVTAVSNYADDVTTRYGIEVDVHCDLATRLEPAIETTVYRIVQEALTNVVKHARAQHVSVILDRHENLLRVVVEDDGLGFPAEQLLRHGVPDRRLGLAGMRERAAMVGGELDIESSNGHGTTLFLRVPLNAENGKSYEETASVAG